MYEAGKSVEKEYTDAGYHAWATKMSVTTGVDAAVWIDKNKVPGNLVKYPSY